MKIIPFTILIVLNQWYLNFIIISNFIIIFLVFPGVSKMFDDKFHSLMYSNRQLDKVFFTFI